MGDSGYHISLKESVNWNTSIIPRSRVNNRRGEYPTQYKVSTNDSA